MLCCLHPKHLHLQKVGDDKHTSELTSHQLPWGLSSSLLPLSHSLCLHSEISHCREKEHALTPFFLHPLFHYYSFHFLSFIPLQTCLAPTSSGLLDWIQLKYIKWKVHDRKIEKGKGQGAVACLCFSKYYQCGWTGFWYRHCYEAMTYCKATTKLETFLWLMVFI